MLNGKRRHYENYLKEVFMEGYKNAAIALAQITHDKIYYNNFHHSFHQIENNSITKMTEINRAGSNILITTEVMGDVPGKNYLLLNQHEFDSLTKGIRSDKNHPMDIKKEFMKELDNILSASVITKLSDNLGMKMYGDVPVWSGPFKGNIMNLIREDFGKGTDEVYISSLFFSFDHSPKIQPFFIWVMHSKIIQTLSAKLSYQM